MPQKTENENGAKKGTRNPKTGKPKVLRDRPEDTLLFGVAEREKSSTHFSALTSNSLAQIDEMRIIDGRRESRKISSHEVPEFRFRPFPPQTICTTSGHCLLG